MFVPYGRIGIGDAHARVEENMEERLGSIVAACLALVFGVHSAACSSSGATEGGSGSTATGSGGKTSGAAGTGAGGNVASNDSGECDNVLVDSLEYYDHGFKSLALAADDGAPYLLMATDDAVVVLTTDGDKLKEVARADDSASGVDLTLSNLLVDHSGYYFDVHRDPRKALVGVPRTGGPPVTVAQLMKSSQWYDLPFVWDDDAMYLIGPAGGRDVLRVPRAAEPSAASQDLSENSGYLDTLSSLGVNDHGVYVVHAYGTGLGVSESPKVPTEPPTGKSAHFTYAMCDTFITPPHVVTSKDALFVNCALQGSGRAVFRIPDTSDWPSDESLDMELTPLVTANIDRDVEVVVGGYLYFADGTKDLIMKVPVTGGAPSAFLRTRSADHLASDGTTLFVDSSCGLQSKAL